MAGRGRIFPISASQASVLNVTVAARPAAGDPDTLRSIRVLRSVPDAQPFIAYHDALAGQPDGLRRAHERVAAQLAAVGPLPRRCRPVLVAMGASHAALAAPLPALRRGGIAAMRVAAGELPAGVGALGDRIVAVSQSGRSRETVAALQGAPAAARVALVNIADSPLAEAAGVEDGGLVLDLGSLPDSKVSTTGYTATVLALGLLAEAWLGAEPDPRWAELADRIEETTAALAAAEAAAVLAARGAIDIAGADASLAAAEGGALLIREAARIAASGYETRQYLHGPMEADVAHVLLGDEREARLAVQLADAGRDVVLLTAAGPASRPNLLSVRVPALPPVQRSIVETAVLQRIGGELAALRGVPVGTFRFWSDDTKIMPATAAGA
jgi:glucosamine--fructose-6-phosphate aminotransferase (isomerizing)